MIQTHFIKQVTKILFLAAFVLTAMVSCGPSAKIVKTWMGPGASVTKNPSNIEKAVNEIADMVSAKMKKDGFLKLNC